MQVVTKYSWQLLFDHSEAASLVCAHSSAMILEANDYGMNLLGYDGTFLKKSLFTDFFMRENKEEWKEQIALCKAGLVQKWETRLLTKRHEIKLVEIKIIEVDEAEDKCLILLKELKVDAEEISEMKKKLSFYETILMEMPTEFAVLNAKWQYLFINRNSIGDAEFRKWMIGKTDFDFCRYRNRDFSIAEKRHAQYNELARTKSGKEWIDEHTTKDGTKKYILRQLHPYFIDDKLNMNFGFGIDITDRVNAEKEREKILKDLTNHNEELQQFAHITSHDLKEPLRTISSFIHILERKYADRFDEKGLEYLQFIVSSADRMSNLLTDLRSFVTLDLYRIEEKMINVDIENIIKNAAENLKLKVLETEADIILPDHFPNIKGHAQYLTQVFQNLLLNAIKFCHEQPKISINWEANKEFTQFAIQDNGIGIDPTYQKKIFRIFNRLDRDKYEGTGMGLAICKKVIQLHRGKMWVESDGTNGSIFFFTLKNKYN